MAEYIEREAFMHFLIKQHCENCDKRKGRKNGKERFIYEIGDAPCRSCGVDDALDYIEYFPSADVHPVVHGQWINTMPIVEYKSFCQVKCSICGSIEAYGNFCRNCGADMRGEL